MELKQLETYVRVYELKSFSKAADSMFLSQPSISAYISSLEKELQTQLIHRSTKEFLPTKSGKLLYEYAKEILSLRDKSVTSLKALSDCSAGSISILASTVPAQYILPETLSEYHKLYPNVVFNVEQEDSSDVVNGISAQRGEIGFIGARIENPKCEYIEFMSEKLIVIAPNDRRYKNIGPDNTADLLRDEYFIMREPGSGTRLEYEGYLKNIGIGIDELKVCAYLNNTQSIIHAVSSGLGISIVSELAAMHYIKHNMITPVYVDDFPQRHFYIVLKKNYTLTATADAFIRFIRSSMV